MDLYRVFFVPYGLAHVVGGLVLWVWPSGFSFVVTDPVSTGAGTLVAFLSIMVGCGFLGAALVDGVKSRRAVIGLALLGNAVNGGGHILNTVRGDAPGHMGILAGLGCGAILVALLVLLFRSQTPRSQPPREAEAA